LSWASSTYLFRYTVIKKDLALKTSIHEVELAECFEIVRIGLAHLAIALQNFVGPE
jgi:hypothetical protein